MAKLDENCSSDDEFLNEFDVPGAALNGREAISLTIPELNP